MPGHGVFSRFAAVLPGGPRGCLHRSNTSMTIIRPPQHGHGGRKSSGSAAGSFVAGGATASSWRASARLVLRELLASSPLVPDAMEAARQDVEQEPTDELVCSERHDLLPVGASAAIVLVAEGDAALVETDEAAVRDGDPVRV